MTPTIEHGLEASSPAPALPPVRLSNGNPLAVLQSCRSVARKAGWSLAQWDEFSASFKACFSADALPEEHAKGLDVVRSHFDVTLTPSFSVDVTQWDHRQAVHD